MIYDTKKSSKPTSDRLVNPPFFASFYKRLFPNMRFGNQPDMPTITTDRLWFLRENRFLFLTRDGPIEVTLKPSFVLTGILVCMAGVAAIFYYTLIASYSAIEVMRDETIQTAEASSNAELNDRINSRVLTWDEYQPAISGITEHTNIKELDADVQLPLIIQGGKRITLANEKRAESSGSSLDLPLFLDSDKSTIKEPSPTDNHKTAKNRVANTDNGQALTGPKHEKKLHPNSNPKIPPANLKATAPKNSQGEIETTRLAARAQEFALALLPSFTAKPKSVKPDTDAKETEDLEKTKKIRQSAKLASVASVASVASIAPDDGLSTNKNKLKSGPTLPVVTEAARVKKMLLAYRKEIDFIRSTVTGLGILQDDLPTPLSIEKQTHYLVAKAKESVLQPRLAVALLE